MKAVAAGHSTDVGTNPSAGAVALRPASDAPAARMTAPGFAAVYEQNFDFVWRSLRRLGVPEASMDDAAQDLFIVVHRRLGEFAGRSSVRTWLFGIALRVAGDYRRRLRRKGAPLRPLPDALPDTTRPGPYEDLARREAARVLDGLLDALDDAKRAVFVLAELEQMTAPEIAEVLDVNVNTVYSRLRAARADFERAVARLQSRSGGR
jgi:RNA polymerase sigma-70 factor (ECF subfamily)